ncbi:LV321 protein, partial [Amia calva]|nr:LV321 protein [Amia calva]
MFSVFIAEGETAATLEQKPTMTKTTGKSARISCKISGIDVSSTIIHWYQQKEGEALKRILYVSTGTALDKGFSAEKNAVAKECNLNIVRLDKQHNAMYYCAYWDTHSEIQPICSLHKNLLTGADVPR